MKKTPKKEESKALVLSSLALSPQQKELIGSQTPREFVKKRPIRGGKSADYVEVGYVIAKLNQAFGALNWDFEVVEQHESQRKVGQNGEGEVWVKGRLTVKDHKQGFEISKTQYGQHEIHKSIPIGDAFKAASSDALKKCATMFGIALDVYWQQLDENTGEGKTSKEKTKDETKEELLARTEKMIRGSKNQVVLLQILERIEKSGRYTAEEKKRFSSMISMEVDKLNA